MTRILRTFVVLSVVGAMSLSVLVPAVAAASDRPFKGTMVGGGGVVEDLTCPIGLRTLSEATGIASHLGSFTMTSSHCTPNPPAGNPPGPILGGRGTFVAANGDAIYFTYSGTVDPLEPVDGATISGVSHHIFTGGTGRFANATGAIEVDFLGTLHFATPMTITWVFKGTLSY